MFVLINEQWVRRFITKVTRESACCVSSSGDRLILLLFLHGSEMQGMGAAHQVASFGLFFSPSLVLEHCRMTPSPPSMILTTNPLRHAASLG